MQLAQCTSVLLLNRSSHILPLLLAPTLPQRHCFSPLQDFVDFSVSVGQLPNKRVGLVHLINLDHGVDGVNTVLFASATARAVRFAAKLYLVFFAVARFQRQLGGSLLLNEVVARAKRNVIHHHELFGRLGPIRF